MAAGLLVGCSRLTAAEHQAFVELREAIRGALAAHTDQVENPAAASRLTVALAPCRLGLAVDPACDTRLVSADHDPFPRVIGAVAVAIAEAAVGGTWARLKSCPGHLCGWAFYDRSASGQSRWCSMQLCGSARRCAPTGDGWHSELLGWARTGVPSYEYESLDARSGDRGGRWPPGGR